MKIDRFFPNIVSKSIVKTKEAICHLLDFDVEYESDWFIHLKKTNVKGLELGLLPYNSDIIPREYQNLCRGTMLTYTVENVDELYEKAKAVGMEILEKPTNQFYGQRRLLLLEKHSGVLIDLSSECEPSEEFLNSF